MASVKIPYLVGRRNRDGSRRFYWQPSSELRGLGWKIRPLGNDEASAIAEAQARNQALAAWRAGEAEGAEAPAAGTLAALVAAYQKSEDFTGLAAKTRQGYEWAIGILETWAGDVPVRALTPKQIRNFWKEMKTATPAKAHAVVTVLRLVLEHGRREAWLEINPAKELALTHARRRRDEAELWTPADVKAFVAAADALDRHSIGTAVLINEWLGQREGDIIALPRAAYAAGEIVFTQAKTGATVRPPADAVPTVRRRLEAELARQRRRKVTGLALILSETTGQPYRGDNFRHVFAAVRAEAAKKHPRLAALQYMTLRHTAVVRMAEAACTVPEIAGITGHSLSTVESILEHYLVRTRKLARAAFAKRLDSEGNGNKKGKKL